MARRLSSISTFKAVLTGGGAVALGSLVAAGAVELGMRALGYGAVSEIAYGHAGYNSDLPEVGYAGRPHVSGIQSGEGLSRVVFNAHGFNDSDHAKTKAPGVFRLMVVGNSYTAALQVSRADGFVARLGEDLRECPALAGREIETVNLGVGGFTIHQQYLMFRDYGLSLSPDFVLLQTNSFVLPGDLDPLKNLSPRLEKQADGEIAVDYSYMDAPEFKKKASHAAMLLQKASDASRLVQYLIQWRKATAQAAAKGAAAPDDPTIYARFRQGRDLAFGELVKQARARNIPLAMTIVPDADSGSDQPFEPTPLWREWAGLAASAKIPFLDIEEQARAKVRATGVYLHGFGAEAGVGHLNRTGNAVFAEALAPQICKLIGASQQAVQSWPLRLE